MQSLQLVEHRETRGRARDSVPVMTITAGTARAALKAAKARWSAEGTSNRPSLYNPQMTRHNFVTVMVDRLRTLTDGAMITASMAKKIAVEVGLDDDRIGKPRDMNMPAERRVFTPRDHRTG